MLFSHILVWAATSLLSGFCLATNGLQAINELQVEAIKSLEAQHAKREIGCSIKNAAVRRDWVSLTIPEKQDYSRAVQCLWDRPSEGRPAFSAAQNLYDDFVATHINQSEIIHSTGRFLTWHRLFIWTWESRLRNECSYEGYLPYWNWFECPDDLTDSSVFDGSDSSMGGDGEYFEHNGTLVANNHFLPSGKGGGCVMSGPFVNRTVHLGPFQPGMEGLSPVMKSLQDHNPRCLRRDLSVAPAAAFTHQNLHNLITGDASRTIDAFQSELQSSSRGTFSMHNAAHYSLGGDATCVASSYNDPASYLHHAMVDRLYWIWQALHPEQARSIAGDLRNLSNVK
ncbi:hypothetical protein PG993_008506 [Apiospora rasikravindrae]|uniref:Tyrosinase copper-binding domain-containing protein n=1 Tax=Apiospora rasikravindrae TaxID=990691 RepID=A0ABR1T0J9_9PEZI